MLSIIDYPVPEFNQNVCHNGRFEVVYNAWTAFIQSKKHIGNISVFTESREYAAMKTFVVSHNDAGYFLYDKFIEGNHMVSFFIRDLALVNNDYKRKLWNDIMFAALPEGVVIYSDAVFYICETGEYGFPASSYIACDVDDDGNVWFTSTHYLLKYDGEKFESYTAYGYNGAVSVLCDGGDVWVYSTDNKLIRFRDGEFAFIDMPAAGVSRVEEIADGEREFSVRCSGGVLSVSGTKGISRLNVYDAAGRCVRSVVCNDGEVSALADISGLCSGVCIVEIFHDGGRTTSLFIAE